MSGVPVIAGMKFHHLPMLAGSVGVIGTAFTIRRYPIDFWLMLAGGIVFLGSTFMIFAVDGFGPFARQTPATAIMSLVSFALLYPTALALGVRFFFTPVGGPARAVYLLAAIVGLSPLLLLAGIALIFVIGGASR